MLATISPRESDCDAMYENFSNRLRNLRITEPVFTTDVEGLYDIYLQNLPESVRQYYTCNACRKFIENYGGLVTISGVESSPVMWDDDELAGPYGRAIAAMYAAVKKAKVTGVYLSTASQWGTPVTGEWSHLAVLGPIKSMDAKEASARMGEFKEDFRLIRQHIKTHTITTLKLALKLLRDGTLTQPERFVQMAEWMLDLRRRYNKRRPVSHINLLWKAVAEAPTGYAHIDNTVLGTLLTDLRNDVPVETIVRKYESKMAPLKYMRPQAPPKSGAIAKAEKIVEKLKTAGSLERRFAKFDEVPKIWEPKQAKPQKGGVFSHLKTKDATTAKDVVGKATTMTWSKFSATALLSALEIQYKVTNNMPGIWLVTALNSEAPPIVQWDRDDLRNPFTWYVRPGGCWCNNAGQTCGAWVDVIGITRLPCEWDPERSYAHQGSGVILLLSGMRDDARDSGGGLFPAHMKAEYREIRSVIEAYSLSAKIHGRADGNIAGGIDLRKGDRFASNTLVRVRTDLGWSRYKLDRWD